jgi:hypothetical protein
MGWLSQVEIMSIPAALCHLKPIQRRQSLPLGRVRGGVHRFTIKANVKATKQKT